MLPREELGNSAAVFQHRGHFDQREIQLAKEAVFHELGDMAQVDVHVFHLAGVDALASLGIGLIRQPQVNAAGHGERSIELRSGGGAGENADLELLASQRGVGDAASQRHRHRFGIAGAGESAHADLVAVMDQRRCFFGIHNAASQAGVQDAGGRGHGSRHEDTFRRKSDQSSRAKKTIGCGEIGRL